MILWFVIAAMTLLTVWALLRPLLRGPQIAPPREAYDRAVYRDQIVELMREEARGLVAPDEARAAEREIARRLLSVAPVDGEPAPAADARGRLARRWSALLIIAIVPLASVALYLYVGAPGVPDLPLAARDTSRQAADMGNLTDAIARVEARLKEHPDDLEGWLLLARSEATLGHFTQAAEAYRKAAALSGDQPDLVSAYAEMLVMAENGTVTPEARQLFETVQGKAPQDARARFYLGLARAQAGDGEGALRDWEALAAESPADAPWQAALREQIQRVAAEFKLDPTKFAPAMPSTAAQAPSRTATPGPSAADVAAAQSMTAAQRDQMIRGMVERLATRLQQQPDDLEGWRRLAQAYRVIGEPAKAIEAYAHAAKLAPENADVLVDYGVALAESAKPGDKLPPAAVTVMRKVLSLDGGRREALWYLGLAAAEGGDKAAAAALWRRLLGVLAPGTPDFEEVKHHLDALGAG